MHTYAYALHMHIQYTHIDITDRNPFRTRRRADRMGDGAGKASTVTYWLCV